MYSVYIFSMYTKVVRRPLLPCGVKKIKIKKSRILGSGNYGGTKARRLEKKTLIFKEFKS